MCLLPTAVCIKGVSLPPPSSSMASILLPPDATLEAYTHFCSVSEVQKLISRTPRERLRTQGGIAVARAMEFNKDSLAVAAELLGQPEIQVNSREFGGEYNTLLHLAVSLFDEVENEENLQGLLSLILRRRDLDPNVGNSKGDTPLHWAAGRASSVSCLAILLGDPRVNVAAVNYKKQTSLHVACEASSSTEIVRKIIKSVGLTCRSFLLKQDQYGNTGLHYAAARGLENVVDAFFEAESLDNYKHELAMKQNHQGNLAIQLAAENGHQAVVLRLLELVDHEVVNIKDQDGFPGLLHQPSRPTFDLYMELLAVAPNKNIADFFLQRLNDEIVKNSEDKEDDYVGNLLICAVSEKRETLVALIVRWYPRQAVVAMHEALDTGNETIEAVVRDHPEVQREFVKMHRKYNYYLGAANAILVVAVLIVTLTFGHCMTSIEAAQYRKDIIELKEFGGPPRVKKIHWTDFTLLPRWAFLQAMIATILAAFAALPFSFAIFFHEIADDTKVKQLLYRTRVLIVTASYFLVMSLEAVLFSFVCSHFLSPYRGCALACEVGLGVFLLSATLFLGFNYWRHRTKGDKRGPTIKFMEMLKIIIAR